MSTQPTGGIVPVLTLGWRMQIALHHAGMTVQDMADELEMTRSTISRWINDHGRPRDIYLKAWALRCGVSYAWLRDGRTESGPDDDDAKNRQNRRPRRDSNAQPTVCTFAQVSDPAAA